METQENIHQEIAALEAQLAAKKEQYASHEKAPEEKEIFREVVTDHAAPATPIPTVSDDATRPTPTPRTPTDEEETEITSLVKHAFLKGIPEAIAKARKSHDAFVVDRLHDRLVDEYYEKLVAARKIKEL